MRYLQRADCHVSKGSRKPYLSPSPTPQDNIITHHYTTNYKGGAISKGDIAPVVSTNDRTSDNATDLTYSKVGAPPAVTKIGSQATKRINGTKQRRGESNTGPK